MCPAGLVQESGRTRTPITYDMLTELDAKGWSLSRRRDAAETKNLAEQEKARMSR